MKKRILSFLLSVCMLLSLLSGMTFSAFAEETIASVVEDVPSLPVEGSVDAAQPQMDAVIENIAIETAPSEEITAELQATHSGTCGDNLTWNLETDTGVLTIFGVGAMTNWSSDSDVPWHNYRSNIKSISIGNSVTSIGEYAFYYCTGLTSVTIGNSVTSIGKEAFFNCYSLTSVTIPDSVTAISDGAFNYCGSLTSVTIPDSVTSIGSSAFSSCTRLTSIEVSGNNPAYSSQDGVLFNKDKTTLIQCPGGKSGAYTIPDSVTSIGNWAFANSLSLTSVTIGSSVTSIGEYAFSCCPSLTSVTIGSSVTSIGEYAFSCCRSLTSVTIPDSVTSIGDWAFSTCTGLTSVTIPDSVTSIGEYAFYDGTSLTSVTIGNSVTSIGSFAFCACTALMSVTFPDSVTSIGYGAFLDCTSLTSVTIPDSVTAISDYAFYDCRSLTDVYYIGTEAQWNAIAIDRGNDALLNAARQYHTEHISGSDAVIIPATCTETGSTSFTCTVCGMTNRESIPALGHDMQVLERVDPTWETEGHESATCSRCGETENTVLPKLKLADLSNDGAINAKDVTLLRRYLTGGYNFALVDEAVADVNTDGVVNAKDITILRRAVAGGYGVEIS